MCAGRSSGEVYFVADKLFNFAVDGAKTLMVTRMLVVCQCIVFKGVICLSYYESSSSAMNLLNAEGLMLEQPMIEGVKIRNEIHGMAHYHPLEDGEASGLLIN